MTDAVGLVPLISFFHPQRLWLLAAVPLLLLLYFGLLQRSRTRARTRGIDNLAKVMPKQAAWKRHVAVVAAVVSLASLTVPGAAVDRRFSSPVTVRNSTASLPESWGKPWPVLDSMPFWR